MKKLDTNMILRIGFGIFFLMWGVEKLRRGDLWASDQMLGSFYGSPGSMKMLVMAFGAVQVLVALSFFTNCKVKIAACISLVMIGSGVVVTIVPLTKYLISGGVPIPTFLFVDHFPLLAGAWAIYANAEKAGSSVEQDTSPMPQT